MHIDIFLETPQVEGQAQGMRRIRQESERTQQERIIMVDGEEAFEK